MQGKIDLRMNNSRPAIGVTKKISLTLPNDTWAWLDEQIEHKHATNRSELLRKIIEGARL